MTEKRQGSALLRRSPSAFRRPCGCCLHAAGISSGTVAGLEQAIAVWPAAGGYYEPDGGAYHVNREGYYWTSWEDIALTFDCSESYSPCLMLNYYAVLGFSVRLFCQLPAE